ncbi:hypothetical protein D3C72_1118520 [compost metagenome]
MSHHQIRLFGDHAFQVDLALITKAHIDNAVGFRPLVTQDLPGFTVAFLEQVIPGHQPGERIGAVEQGQRQNIAPVLHHNALRLLLDGQTLAGGICQG